MTTEELAYLLQVITSQQRTIDGLNATVKEQLDEIGTLQNKLSEARDG